MSDLIPDQNPTLEYGRPTPSQNNGSKRLLLGIFSMIIGGFCGPVGIFWAELINRGLPRSWMATILFPFTTLTGDVTFADGLLLFIQYPIYGIIIGLFAFSGRFRYGLLLVLLIHGFGILLGSAWVYMHPLPP